jgi:hypothetical protein
MHMSADEVKRLLSIYGGNLTWAGKAVGLSERQMRSLARDKYRLDINSFRAAGPKLDTKPIEVPKDIEQVREVERRVEPAELVQAQTKVARLEERDRQRERIHKELTKQANVAHRIEKTVEPYMRALALPAVEAPTIEREEGKAITLSLTLNDIHWGKVFDGAVLRGLNAYNPNIAARRLQKVVDTTVKWIENYREMGHPVEKLIIPAIGDNVNGNLHPEDEDNYADIIVQMIDMSLVMGQIGWELSHHVPEIVWVWPAGDNHSRLTKKSATSAKAMGTTVNTALATNVALLLSQVKHNKVLIDRSHHTFYNVYGRTWGAAHGNLLAGGGGSLGIPAYGMAREHHGNLAETVIMAKRQMHELKFDPGATEAERLQRLQGLLEGIVDHTLIGHFHTRAFLEFAHGDLSVEPSAMGTDPYARDALRRFSPARQMLRAIHPTHDVIGEHVIQLGEFKDPDVQSRYHWGIEDRDNANPAEMMDEWLNATP